MHKKFILFFFLLSWWQLVFAAQCPDPSEWSHEKGKEWQLSIQAQLEGWQAMTLSSAIDSDLIILPADKHLLVGILKTGYKFTTCGYSLSPNDPNDVISAINTRDAVDMTQLKSFKCIHSHCTCNTAAGHPEACAWTWKR